MHEFSFGEGLVAAVLREYEEWKGKEEKNGRVVSVTVVAGKLHQIIEDNLRMAFDVLSRNTVAEGASLRIKFEEITYRCNVCGAEGIITPPLFICASCYTGDLDLLTGKELYLEKMEIKQDESYGNQSI